MTSGAVDSREARRLREKDPADELHVKVRETDRELIQRMLAGEEAVFTAFFELYAQRLAVFAARRSSFPEGANHIVAIETGMEVLVDREGVHRGSYPTYGDSWAWVESIAPSYDIENRQLAEFLVWVARETGRRITFVDAHARDVSNHTTLHGSVQGLRPWRLWIRS